MILFPAKTLAGSTIMPTVLGGSHFSLIFPKGVGGRIRVEECMTLFPAKTFSRKHNHADSLDWKPFFVRFLGGGGVGGGGVIEAGTKGARTVSGDAKYDGLSLQ